MKKRGTKANIFLLDLCRTMKYARGGTVPSETPRYTSQTSSVFVYAAALGQIASDDGGDGHGKDMVEETKCGYRVSANSCRALCILLPARIN